MPVNTNVLRGATATLNLASIDSREGLLAEGIFNTEYNIGTVGRVTGVEVLVETELESFHEIGRRHPVSLHPGNINISGRVARAYINGALLRLLMGDQVEATPAPEELQPAFNLVIDLTDVASPDGTVGTKIVVSGVQFENWHVVVPEDDFIMENVTFKALRIAREEKQGG
ncbi:MAG: hypothetical protein DCC55_03210 [Chloroflexi bacterium]|nr:MAG: hypothetical protein DCC55_03210 [Chloroflexota bacterium]